MWRISRYSVKPQKIDNTSSSVYVYIRKNITEVETEDGDTLYECEEQLISKEDWELYEAMLNHDAQLTEVQDALMELAAIIGG